MVAVTEAICIVPPTGWHHSRSICWFQKNRTKLKCLQFMTKWVCQSQL